MYTVPSASGKSRYRIEVDGADISCDCKGFTYRGVCRHVRDLKQALATGETLPDGYRLKA